MAEYYELVLTHRVQNGAGYDPYIEQPIVIKGFISPLVQESMCDERAVLIDEMCGKLKSYFMQKRMDGEQV